MVRVDLEEALPPVPSINIPSTNYHVLPSGNLGSTSRVLDIPSSPQHHGSLDVPLLPVDNPAFWNDEPRPESEQLSEDPAYLEHIDVDYVTTKRSRLSVSLSSYFTTVQSAYVLYFSAQPPQKMAA